MKIQAFERCYTAAAVTLPYIYIYYIPETREPSEAVVVVVCIADPFTRRRMDVYTSVWLSVLQ